MKHNEIARGTPYAPVDIKADVQQGSDPASGVTNMASDHTKIAWKQTIPALLSGLLGLALLASGEAAWAAGGLDEIPPKRLLLVLPVIVLVIIGVLLVVTRRR